MTNGKLMFMKTEALLFLPLMLIATGVAQTRPLSVCDIVKHTGDWDNNVVLIPVITTVGWKIVFYSTVDVRAKRYGSTIPNLPRRKMLSSRTA